MVKGFCFALLLAVSAAAFSQPATTPASSLNKQDFLTKGLHHRHAANAMLWGGFALVVTGGIIDAYSNYGSLAMFSMRKKKKYDHTGGIIAVTGLTSMVGSIPLFISYHSHKRKAGSLSLKTESVPVITGQSISNHPFPSLCLKMSL